MTITTNAQRRRLLQAAAGIGAAGPFGLGSASAAALPPAATGKPGDFDFLSGQWTIRHKQLKDKNWESFDGEATVIGMLGGLASVEELRIPAKDFSGMGLRILDIEKKLWADHWCNRRNGVLTPAAWGSFTNGVGTWDSADMEAGKPVITRGVWDRISPSACRWYQAVSRDGGATWEENWIMDWQRSGSPAVTAT
ncbi:hypothetical protein IV454_26205 [Massilia antarctica]|uniref:DUF1579 domain-containing protein n=1 Tax=Massilia antarctica TaxID=2765360 RepID=A0AA48WCC2_9BURK|nr:hypothetical protein [Massilia antarctica]QPI48944.1 hypothetical protein IV454_26205 [Massilia antarctica]